MTPAAGTPDTPGVILAENGLSGLDGFAADLAEKGDTDLERDLFFPFFFFLCLLESSDSEELDPDESEDLLLCFFFFFFSDLSLLRSLSSSRTS